MGFAAERQAAYKLIIGLRLASTIARIRVCTPVKLELRRTPEYEVRVCC